MEVGLTWTAAVSASASRAPVCTSDGLGMEDGAGVDPSVVGEYLAWWGGYPAG